MSHLQGNGGELKMTVFVTRKETGDTEMYELTGAISDTQLAEFRRDLPYSETALSRALALRAKIYRHNTLYHQLNEPEISDAEFDGLLRELQMLELAEPGLVTVDSPTQTVGWSPSPPRLLEEQQHGPT